MDSAQIRAFFKKADRPVVAYIFITLVCLMVLVTNRNIFGLSPKPLSSEALYAAEIDGCLNFISNQNGQTCFSVREQANQLFSAALIPLSAKSNFDFFSNAAVGDFIHKPGDSDTVILIKNNERYYFKLGE